MSEDYPIRPIDAAEFPAFHEVLAHAFNSARPAEPSIRHEQLTFEADRSLAALDGTRIVGCAWANTFTLTVPGGSAPAAGISGVGVLPSHRRRGILTGLMRRQLGDVRERGEAIAVLFASETGIYGRFGYGPASQHATFTIRRGEGAMAPGAAASSALALDIVAPAAVTAELARVYEAVLPGRSGLFARDDRWWSSLLADPEHEREGAGPQRCLLAATPAGPLGYALYSARPSWEEGLPNAAITVHELMAADPAAATALWSDLLSRDLVGEVVAHLRPVDDPLLYLLADSRRARMRVSDGLWVRLVDVGRALAQRRYAAPVDVVIEVTDQACPWNAGRYRLTTQPRETAEPGETPAPAASAGMAARCERASGPADISLPVQALGAAYLGGTRLGPLAEAGLVTELRPGAISALSAALSWDRAPWCPQIF
ncbi:MAG: GNAT family N-acetyltransferase [Nocardiopsaceae bacterium]|jgi:predicted acetyltransferase|nr:GNAT family N-acetyltransferase [Nocardiopsaceae bacterium]